MLNHSGRLVVLFWPGPRFVPSQCTSSWPCESHLGLFRPPADPAPGHPGHLPRLQWAKMHNTIALLKAHTKGRSHTKPKTLASAQAKIKLSLRHCFRPLRSSFVISYGVGPKLRREGSVSLPRLMRSDRDNKVALESEPSGHGTCLASPLALAGSRGFW
jgi:hypothetical protein